uniref:Uncharacterized protein n=1 Tax=Setaria viridis TaxID=4556 RepID=A0A4U6TMN2_SETVI|nr:hypothetical protein SEVIR_7G000400v2 [Setaria viridis]
MRRRVKNEDRMPRRKTAGAEKGGSRLAFEGQAIVRCTSTVPGYTAGGRRWRFPDYVTKSGVHWLSHKAMHRTGTLVRRAKMEILAIAIRFRMVVRRHREDHIAEMEGSRTSRNLPWRT